MILKKTWYSNWTGYCYRYHWKGWFLFGFIPLYIIKEEAC